jgi:protein-disulfide isomerase
MKRVLPFLIIGVVGLITAASAVVLYQAKKPPTLSSTVEETKPATAGATESATEPPIAEMANIRGPAEAPVTIEEFGDFQCPPCGMMSEPLNQIERDFTGKVRLIFRHFPLDKHLNARRASQAAEAAGLQNRFWEMHDLLYREQEAWSNMSVPDGLFVSYATTLGLDPEKFRQDMESPEVNERVSADEMRAAKLGVTLTPTVFVNGRSINLAQGPVSIRAAVEAALAEAPANP